MYMNIDTEENKDNNFYDKYVVSITAVTSLIPGVMLIHFILLLINFRGQRDSILRGILIPIAMFISLWVLFWISLALFGGMSGVH